MSKFASLPLPEAFGAAVAESGAKPGSRIVAGVSGGVDSMTLLHLLVKTGYRPEVVHVNYGKRGAASDADETLVQQTCAAFKVPFHPFQYTGSGHGNFQDNARLFRRNCFLEVMKQTDAVAIATGHHLNDRLETFLMRILRGSAPSSWDGLRRWDAPFLRPLLGFTREQILDFATENAISWRDDASNQTTDYARNLLRNEVLSRMEPLFPGWQSNLEKAATFGAVYETALDHILGDTALRLEIRIFSDDTSLNAAIIHRFLQRNAISVSHHHVVQILELVNAQKGRKTALGGGKWLIREAEALQIIAENDREPFYMLLQFRSPEKKLRLPFGTAFICEKAAVSEKELFLPGTDGWEIRNWKPGDRIEAIPGRGSRKVSDLLTDWKVPTAMRASAYVAALDGKARACIFAHPGEVPRCVVSEQVDTSSGIGICITFSD